MKKCTCCFLLSLACAGSILSAPPDVPKEIRADPGQLVRIVVKIDAEVGYLRNFDDTEGFFGELVSPKGQRQFVFQPPAKNPRAYYVVGFWTKGEVEGVAVTIVVGSTPVPPKPEPNPHPDPTPDPVVKPVTKLWSVVVEDVGGGNIDRGSFYGDKSLTTLWTSPGYRFRIVGRNDRGPDGQPPADVAQYVKDAQEQVAQGKLKYPVLYVVNQDGDELHRGNLPPSPAELVTLLKKWQVKP